MAKMAYPQSRVSSLCIGSRSTISGVARSCKRSSFKPSGRRAWIGARRAPRGTLTWVSRRNLPTSADRIRSTVFLPRRLL